MVERPDVRREVKPGPLNDEPFGLGFWRAPITIGGAEVTVRQTGLPFVLADGEAVGLAFGAPVTTADVPVKQRATRRLRPPVAVMIRG